MNQDAQQRNPRWVNLMMRTLKSLLKDYTPEPVNSPQSEMLDYFSQPPVVGHTKSLSWWKVNQTDSHWCPDEPGGSCAFLPATSTPSQCVFSVAANIVVPKRGSLEPFAVDELVFPHSAMRKARILTKSEITQEVQQAEPRPGPSALPTQPLSPPLPTLALKQEQE